MDEVDKFDKSWILSTPLSVTQKWGKQKELHGVVFWQSPFYLTLVWIASDSTAMEGERQREEGELGNGKGAVVKAVALETIWLDSFSVPA